MVDSFVTTTTKTEDNLISGHFPLVTKALETLLSGQNLLRGTLLGKITKAVGAITPGSNTGGGTCTGFSLGKYAKLGSYILTCIEAVTGGGIFSVTDPDGSALKRSEMGAYTSNQINFTLTDVGTDFIVGDSFTLLVSAGSGKLVKSLLASVDGSQEIVGVLTRDVDASLGDKTCEMYLTGQFNKEKVTYGTGHTYANTVETLRKLGIYLEAVSIV